MSDKYEVLKLKNQLCFPLYAASREIIKQYHDTLSKLDLTYTQYLVMMVLWEEEKISVCGLGRKLYLDSGTLTPLLKGLEKKGLVKRTRSKQDERYLVVSLTEKGISLKEQAVEVPMEIACQVGMKKEEAEELYKLLYKLIDCMTNENDEK